MRHPILRMIDRAFDAGTYENFRLNEVLLVLNTFLLFITVLVMMHDLHWIIIPPATEEVIKHIEIGFGILFLIEFLLRVIYAYWPDRTLFTFYPIVQLLVIFSLLLPSLINIAFLRIIVSLKMLKIYHMRREQQRRIAHNPTFAVKETTLEKLTHAVERPVDHITAPLRNRHKAS